MKQIDLACMCGSIICNLQLVGHNGGINDTCQVIGCLGVHASHGCRSSGVGTTLQANDMTSKEMSARPQVVKGDAALGSLGLTAVADALPNMIHLFDLRLSRVEDICHKNMHPASIIIGLACEALPSCLLAMLHAMTWQATNIGSKIQQ